jgi:hypothetical protein
MFFCPVPRAERVVELGFEWGESDASVEGEVEYGGSLEVETGKGNRFYERWRREKGIQALHGRRWVVGVDTGRHANEQQGVR